MNKKEVENMVVEQTNKAFVALSFQIKDLTERILDLEEELKKHKNRVNAHEY